VHRWRRNGCWTMPGIAILRSELLHSNIATKVCDRGFHLHITLPRSQSRLSCPLQPYFLPGIHPTSHISPTNRSTNRSANQPDSPVSLTYVNQFSASFSRTIPLENKNPPADMQLKERDVESLEFMRHHDLEDDDFGIACDYYPYRPQRQACNTNCYSLQKATCTSARAGRVP
jgi:hypothetical protein